MDLSNLKIKDLNELIEKAKKRISEIEKSEAQEVRAKLFALAKEHGYDAAQLIGGGGAAPAKAAAAGEKVRRPAKAKYQDPNSSATWTGRGLKPLWVRAAIESGKTLESLEIK
jgi:DNA-binding protein H-NS